MSEATRNYTEKLCRSVCKSYKNKIEILISDAGRLPKNGQILVSNYENNLDSEKDFFNQAVNDNKFFLDYSDQDLLKIAKYCYIINKDFMLGVKFDSEITKIVPDIIKQKINLEKYESGWLFLTDKNKHVTRIINNDGKNIIFLDSKGKIIKKSQFEQGLYTKFFGDNLGITRGAANELLKKARYTWDSDKKLMKGGYKAFDLNGNEIEYLYVKKQNKPEVSKTTKKITTNFKKLMKKVKIDDLSSPCCDLYSTRVLEIINKKPIDWPNPAGYKVCNTLNYKGNNYKDYYSSKWKTSPAEGWNVMIMWANAGEKFENSPHMAILQKKGNNYNLTHFTGNEQKIRENWSLDQVQGGFDYSNFRYMSLGK